jgi:hypothetical protein
LKTPYLSIKQRFLLLVTAALLLGLAPTIYAEGLSGLEDSIKEGNISEENNATNEALTDEINKNKADQIKKSSLAKSIKIKAQHPKNKFLKIVGDTFKKLKKLKPNPLSKLKQFNIPQFLKKKKSATRISDVAKLKMPKRIEESENPPSNGSIIVPSPEKEFGFPVDKNDKIRISGEVEVQRLYELACSTISKSPGNDAIFQKMKEIANEIFKKYSAYPDLCAISKLYLIDAQARLGIEAEYSNGSASPMLQVEVAHRDYFKKYLQIMIDYANEINKPNISKIIDFINKNRIEKFLKNDENAQKAIAFYIDKLEEDSAFLNEYINETAFYGENTDIYVSVVVSTMNAIISDYSALHYYSVMTSDYETAEYLFKSEYKDGKLAFSGVIKDLYDSIPKEVPYHHVTGYDEHNDPIITTDMVEIYREPGRILEVVKSARNAELLKYSHTFLDDENNTNLTLEKVKAISEWLKNYEPDREGKKGTPEKMSQENVDYLHDNAYGPNNYYKNTHIIKKIYFTRIEPVEINEEVYHPSALVNIRAEIESSGSEAPFYEFKIKIENLKDSERFKQVRFSKDYILGGYYSRFQPNETDDSTDKNKNLIDITPPYQNGSLNAKSLATYHGEKKFDYPSALWGSSYFNVKLMRAVVKELYDSNDKENIISSPSFLRAGGAEYIMAKKDNMKCPALIKHTADYFVVTGHGSESTGMVGEVENNVIKNGISPEELITVENGALTYSEYDNMRFLILAVCNCLNHYSNSQYNNAEEWYKVLPNGVILGYHGKTLNIYNDNALKIIADHLSDVSYQNLDPYTMGYLWAWANKKAFVESNLKINTNSKYAFIVHGAYFHGEKIIKSKQKVTL